MHFVTKSLFVLGTVVFLSAQKQSVVDELEKNIVPEGRAGRDMAQSNLRYERGHIFDRPDPGPETRLDIQADNSVSALFVRVPVLPDLPAEGSDAVILGTVTSQEAFFSPNRAGIYVESVVRADQVFKGSLVAGSSTAVLSPGGTIRTHDGRVITQRVEPTGMTLLPGKQFVLFLRTAGGSGAYVVIRAWMLTEDRVFPADAPSLRELRHSGTAPFQFASREEFLQHVRDAVKNSQR